jgi:beta-galactosidase
VTRPASRAFLLAFLLFCIPGLFGQNQTSPRRHLSLGRDWRFALGNATDSKKDFGFDDGQLFFYGKAGHGNGPADPHFDDRTWRPVDVPHDWAVTLPFDSRGDSNHGSKAIGRNFPENSVGWYRKSFTVPPGNEGNRIRIDFDGVYRNSQVWLNGFYIGTEPSGYASFGYDVTDYINFDQPNTLVVRADATTDEGWFYEGAGIYRHVWLDITAPAHVAHDGTYVITTLNSGFTAARVNAQITVVNDSLTPGQYNVTNVIEDPAGKQVAEVVDTKLAVQAGSSEVASADLPVAHPSLWSTETPVLYKLVTTIRQAGKVVDTCETRFGIRQVEWTADHGFFLNGKHVEIKGTNDHQDDAGVGIALPDDLQTYRIERLKALGSNAIRTSHHPPTPALLDAADRLGMLILDEARMMGTTPEDLGQLTRQIEHDRNHPSVILWSLGNEEWALEWSVYGARLARDLTAYAQRLDPSRRSTVAMSGSSAGISLGVDVMGFNYYLQHHIDDMHRRFPNRPIVGTEESSSEHTRGMYFDDPEHQHLVGFDFEADGKHASIEDGWRYYQDRPYAAGLFYWTGFDYRGETTPFDYPAISSQFGLLDTCGFMKDTAYLAQSFWTDGATHPMVHLATTWTIPNRAQHGAPDENVPVLVYSNAAAVELLLNGKSLGRKPMPRNSHLEWQVPYSPGTLSAVGYNAAGAVMAHDVESTTSAPARLHLVATKNQLAADGTSLSIVTVTVEDAQNRIVPDASNLVSFELSGPGKIIGVGNGDPSSHEPDQYLPNYTAIPVINWHTKAVDFLEPGAETSPTDNAPTWPLAQDPRWDEKPSPPAASVFRGEFTLPSISSTAAITLFLHRFGEDEAVFLNGHALKLSVDEGNGEAKIAGIPLDPAILVAGRNVLTLYARRFTAGDAKIKDWTWSRGGPANLSVVTPAGRWQRSVFNGLAQIIVQSSTTAGTLTLTATSPNLRPATVEVKILSSWVRSRD